MSPDDAFIENRTFDEIEVGDSACLSRKLSEEDIKQFAAVSGDVNPAHVDPEFARSDAFHQVIAHGMWGGALISTVLGTELPGPGAIYLDQTLRFLKPITVGETVIVTVTAREKIPEHHRISFACTVVDEKGDTAIDGTALVIAPTEKIRRPRVEVASVEVEERGAKFRRLIEQAESLQPIVTAVVHPVDSNSLGGAIAAARAKLIVPVLVGPEDKIRAAAETLHLDITPYRIESVPHSHAAASRAVELVRAGEVRALMKGSLHTDEFMHPIVDSASGLRTERRLSHVYVVDLPGFDRPLFVTDGGLNIAPTLIEKRDIVQNAVDMAHALGIELPKVAVLSAVETVTPKMVSTLDAAALCKMADRGQISGAIVDGPLAFDNAVTPAAAKTKGIHSPVAGCADILVVPDVEAGNMLAKQLDYLAGAEAAGVVIGARVPIILTSRSDSVQSRLVSSAIAALIEAHQLKAGP